METEVYTRKKMASISGSPCSSRGRFLEIRYNGRRKSRRQGAMEFEFLDQLKEKWEPVSKPVLIGWLVFYGLFLLYAARATDGLIIDNVNLVIHESGHLLFGWLGNQTIMVAGGTIMQLLVPFLLACFFVYQRQPIGTA